MSTRVMFELSMPNVGSWNGKWSGEDDIYTVSKTLTKKNEDLIGQDFYYNFGDGWGASVKVREARPREKATNRFCGYEWMIDSILANRKIEA